MNDYLKPEDIAPTLTIAISNLCRVLDEAYSYLDNDKHLAAIGTLAEIDKLVADLDATLHIFRTAAQRNRP